MMMKKNKGVSMPEVLIALAVFMVMMIPLVSSLISGMKTTNTSKETQSRDDYARNLMENIIEMPMSVLDTADTDYFEKKGSENGSVLITTNSDTSTYHVTKLNGTNEACAFDSYSVYGKTYFGVNRQKYSYLIDVSNEAYAKEEAAGADNPNHADYGIVESLDQSKVALISATMSNYDSAAYDVILSKKMADLRIQHDKQEADRLAADPLYEKQLFDVKSEVQKFKDDKGSRQIRVSVSGSKSSGYEVKCTLYYKDSCGLSASAGGTMSDMIGTIEYVPFVKKFEKLPNIYLMYNVGVYNNKYMDDFIVCDLDGLADEKDDVNIFVVETAETYSSDTADLISSGTSVYSDRLRTANDRVSSGSVLYRKTSESRNAVVGIYLSVRKKGMNDNKRDRLHIYHNLGVPDMADYNNDAKGLAAHTDAVNDWNTHKKNEKITPLGGDILNNLFGTGDPGGDCEVPASVKVMNDALEDVRNLYTVKIYMREGDVEADALRLTDPVLVGSKGGGAIE